MTIRNAILDQLIAFPTVSRDSNIALIDYVRDFLSERGIEATLYPNEDGSKANLFATIGPKGGRGIMLSGHTDVVPVEGQNWSRDPFAMWESDGALYGRGTADMKGFLACALAMVDRIDAARLKTPIHLSFSYDEEVGCLGVRKLIDGLKLSGVRPRLCIVGEPTSMQVVVAHKGKTALNVACTGLECHSSLAPHGLNAIYMASELIEAIRGIQAGIVENGPSDDGFGVGYSTLHVGTINGGSALNIVPNRCGFEMEIRHIPEQPAAGLVGTIREAAARIEARAREHFPGAAIEVEDVSSYPALNTDPDSEVATLARTLSGHNGQRKVAFGTEGGLFQECLDLPTVVCGPGDIAQAHKPDEFIAEEQLSACSRFLDRMVDQLCH